MKDTGETKGETKMVRVNVALLTECEELLRQYYSLSDLMRPETVSPGRTVALALDALNVNLDRKIKNRRRTDMAKTVIYRGVYIIDSIRGYISGGHWGLFLDPCPATQILRSVRDGRFRNWRLEDCQGRQKIIDRYVAEQDILLSNFKTLRQWLTTSRERSIGFTRRNTRRPART